MQYSDADHQCQKSQTREKNRADNESCRRRLHSDRSITGLEEAMEIGRLSEEKKNGQDDSAYQENDAIARSVAHRNSASLLLMFVAVPLAKVVECIQWRKAIQPHHSNQCIVQSV